MAILRNNNLYSGEVLVKWGKKSEEHNLNTLSRAPEASSQTKGGSYMDHGEDYKGDQDL